MIENPSNVVAPNDVRESDVIIDARKHPGKQQIRGALRYDPQALLQTRAQLPLARDRRVIVDAESQAAAQTIGDHLAQLGFPYVGVLLGGFEAWKRAGLPLEEATQEQPIPDIEGSGLHRL